MANDYSAAALSTLQVKLMDVFPESLRTQTILFENPATAVAMLENQTAKVAPVTVDGRCTGFDIIYMISDSTVVNTGTASPSAAACTIVPNRTFSADSQSYDINRYFERKISIPGKDCDSFIKMAERVRFATEQVMQELALSVNQHYIAQLIANIQTATHQGEFSVGITGGIVEYSQTQMRSDEFDQVWMDWALVAQEENLPARFLTLNGNNFWNKYNLSAYNRLNDDQRSQAPLFGDRLAAWDVRGFSRAGISDSSFLVDPNAYVFFSRSWYTATPTLQEGNDKTTYVFSLPLTYIDTTGGAPIKRTMQHRVGGRLMPIMVDVEYQYTCNTTDTVDGNVTYDWMAKYKINGGLQFAPNIGQSGIVRIDAV